MAVVMETELGGEGLAGVAPEVKERLVGYMADVASGLGRVEQRRAAGVYARGLVEAGGAQIA